MKYSYILEIQEQFLPPLKFSGENPGTSYNVYSQLFSETSFLCFTFHGLYIYFTQIRGLHAGTIFVYGQTSSGKTHTMMGRQQHAGIIPLSIGGIFDYIESVSFLMEMLASGYWVAACTCIL